MVNKTKNKLISFLRKEYKLVIFDEESMTQKKVFRLKGSKIVWIGGGMILLTALISVAIATQTGILRYLGPRPGLILDKDYISLAAHVDSLQLLYNNSEKKFSNLEQLLTKQIESTKKAHGGDDVQLEPFGEENKWADKPDKLPLLSFIRPVTGEVTSSFDLSKLHYGIDLAAKSGSKVLAIADGYVMLNGYSREDGFVLMIQHPNGYASWYKHNSMNIVMTGQKVFKGEPIAIIGNTGENSTGPHLHFELWKDDMPLDPGKIISETVK